MPDADHKPTFGGNTEGWTSELGELAAYLDDKPDLEAVAQEVFSALADPTRRGILAALAAGGPATATDLAAKLPITR